MNTLTQEIARLQSVTDHQTAEVDGNYTCTSGCGFAMKAKYAPGAESDWYHQTYANGIQLDLQRGGTVEHRTSDAAGWTWEMVGGHGTTTPPSGHIFAGEIFVISPEGVRYKAAPGPLGISPGFFMYTHGLGLNLVPFS